MPHSAAWALHLRNHLRDFASLVEKLHERLSETGNASSSNGNPDTQGGPSGAAPPEGTSDSSQSAFEIHAVAGFQRQGRPWRGGNRGGRTQTLSAPPEGMPVDARNPGFRMFEQRVGDFVPDVQFDGVRAGQRAGEPPPHQVRQRHGDRRGVGFGSPASFDLPPALATRALAVPVASDFIRLVDDGDPAGSLVPAVPCNAWWCLLNLIHESAPPKSGPRLCPCL